MKEMHIRSLWNKALPAILCSIFLVLSFLPFSSFALSSYVPDIWLMMIYYWAIFNPRFIPQLLLFLVAILYDTLSMLPLGMTAVLWMSLRLIISYKRRSLLQQSFWALWGGFLVVTCAVYWFYWVLAGSYYDTSFTLAPTFTRILSTVSCYPFMHMLFTSLHRRYQLSIGKGMYHGT